MSVTPEYLSCPIWQKLAAFNFDDIDAQFPFTDKLAKENHWTKRYAEEVVKEYRRFLYLSATHPRSFSPSDEVDQAWHLHMLYTRSYWHDLCRDTLGKEIHHGPSKGGVVETNKFKEIYEETLKIYEEEFNSVPPPKIWPSVEENFKNKNYKRLSVEENIIMSKQQVSSYLKRTGAVLVGLFLLLFFTSADSAELRGFDFWKTLCFLFLIGLGAFFIRGIWRYLYYNSSSPFSVDLPKTSNTAYDVNYKSTYEKYSSYVKPVPTKSLSVTKSTSTKSEPTKSKSTTYSGSSNSSKDSSSNSSSSSSDTSSDSGITAAAAFFGCSTTSCSSSSPSSCSTSSCSSGSSCSSSSCSSSSCSSGCGGGCGS